MRPHLTGRGPAPLLPLFSLVAGLLVSPGGAAHAGPAPPGDRAAPGRAAAALTVHGLGDVRGNPTLPAAGAHGTSVTRRSHAPGVIGATGIVHRPEPGAGPERGKLAAVVTRGRAAARRAFTASVPELPRKQPFTAYAMNYFTGEGPVVFRSGTEAEWYLFIDESGGRGYVPFESTGLDSERWTASAGHALPAGARHGTVLPVTQEEYERLLGAYTMG